MKKQFSNTRRDSAANHHVGEFTGMAQLNDTERSNISGEERREHERLIVKLVRKMHLCPVFDVEHLSK